ncbi:hypothetical protein IWQ56_003543 [Coemansia nantahalensis]|uniref:Uncharacterized protein n=1 Tax=Coemansia nantahalensis TaxID=2789366 RepID=A0ACC1JYI4_9FUNG|nr:hypothetical protein IWQ56_003543 [Coemansia nantahalensis]KAJ2769794.1 hypothetical protein IWQ57_002952 [Coemansia nantahalensis]
MVAYTRLGQVRGWGWSKTETTRLQSVVGAIVAVSDAPEAVAAAAREEPWLLLDDSASENLARQFWVYIASRVQTRTAHQCQQKWQSIAQASSSGRCTTDEAPRLAQLVEEHGRRWTFLASEYFPGRRPRELYHLHTRWCNIEKRYGVDLSKIDPFSRICDYKGSSALRPTGGNGDYDPSGPLVRVSKTGLVSALAPYILAVTKVGPPQKRRRRSLASKLSGASSWAAVPSEIADRLFAALSRYKNDWVSISRSVGIPARECRKYADILGERLPSVRASIRDAELEQLARDHKTQPHGSDAT